MTIFNFWKNNLFFWSAIISLTIFFITQGRENALLKGVLFFTGGLQTISVHLHSDISDTVRKYLFLLSVRDENKQLKNENARLTAENQFLRELEYENDRLERLAGFTKREKSALLPARVVATSLLSQNQMFVIDRGTRDGVQKYMGVIHPKGVVGYVFRTTPSSSQVVTLFNRLSSLPVINQRSRSKGLIEAGLKSKTLVLKYFNLQGYSAPDFKEGDWIVTEETKQFHSGFPVGVIHSIQQDRTTTRQTVLIKPNAPFTAIETVFVVLKPQMKLKKP